MVRIEVMELDAATNAVVEVMSTAVESFSARTVAMIVEWVFGMAFDTPPQTPNT